MTADMTAVIQPKSDQINADDLIAGPRTIRISEVRISPGTEQPVSIYFDGSDKAFRPCKSMSRVMVAVWGPDAKQYVGRSLTLYRDADVKWGGMAVGGIRISHMSHMENTMTMALTATKGSRKPYKVQPLSADVIDAAAKWTADYIGKIASVTSLDELKALETLDANVKAVAKLEANRPDLYQQIAKATANIADGFVSQAGNGEATTLADALDAIAKATDADAVTAIVRGNLDGLSDTDRDTLVAAGNARVGEMEGDD